MPGPCSVVVCFPRCEGVVVGGDAHDLLEERGLHLLVERRIGIDFHELHGKTARL